MKGVPTDGYAKMAIDNVYIKVFIFDNPSLTKKLKKIIVRTKLINAE